MLPTIRVGSLAAAGAANRYLLSAMLSLEEAFAEDDRLPPTALEDLRFDAYLERRFPVRAAADPIVLIFDQFEEIIAVEPADRDAKEEFFTQVGQALGNWRRWALFAVREEYVARLEPFQRAGAHPLRQHLPPGPARSRRGHCGH